MARQLKPQSIGEYDERETHTRVELFLDRNTHEFFANFAGTRYESNSKGELIGHLQKAIRASLNIEWKSLIEVRRLEPAHYSFGDRSADPAFVGFRLNRYHYGQLADGTWVAVQWQTQDHLRIGLRRNFGWERNKEFNPPCSIQGHAGLSDTFYLPYDEVSWMALNQLVENIRAVRRTLDGMLASEDGIGQLVQAIADGMGMKMKMLSVPGEENP